MRIILSIAVVALVVTPSARAADAKAHPGSMCQSLEPSLNHFVFVEGFVALEDGSTDEAVCPVLRDNTLNSTGLDDLEMQVIDGGSGTIVCNAHAVSATG